MATKPTKPTAPDPALRTSPDTFSARIEANILFWSTLLTYIENSNDFIDEVGTDALAAVLAGEVSPGDLAGQGGNLLGVNEGETAFTFFNAETIGLGSIATQDADDVAIAGGAIDVSTLAIDGDPVAPAKVNNTFTKADPDAVAWTKTAAGTAETQTQIYVDVNGSVLSIASGTSITMPTLTAGTDYAIWANTDGTLEASSNHTMPPAADARKVGGFHYAPGGNATAQSGGNTTPQINEYSFWDVAWRPACSDPRGMTLVADAFWADIYLCGVDAITNGSSAYNVTIASNDRPPKVPAMFGGNGTTTYDNLTWFDAQELALAFGKRCFTQQEFMAAAYGTTEVTSSGGSDVHTTGVDGTGATNGWEKFTSKWGMIQSTGCVDVWGRDRGGPYDEGWDANTEGRGSEHTAPNAVVFGGSRGDGEDAGSRASDWHYHAVTTLGNSGARFVCDHLKLG
jgi:hypothetical protein